MTTIVVADDHALVRRGLRLTLEELGYSVIGEASDGLEAVQTVGKLRPDILLCDMTMGAMSGIEIAKQVTRQHPEVGIIILSMHSDEAYVIEALRAGASAYILKESAAEEIAHAIAEVTRGRHYLGPFLWERAIDAYSHKPTGKDYDPFDTLSEREREVLQMVAGGMTSGEIARKIIVSPRTIEARRASLMHKLGLHSRADVIRFALHRGVIPR